MKPPTKFEIMRMNRGFGEFVNDKQQLLCGIDCAELHVLRTLMKGQKEEPYPAAERVAAELGMPLSDAEPDLACRRRSRCRRPRLRLGHHCCAAGGTSPWA
jgi:hypothetical protein